MSWEIVSSVIATLAALLVVLGAFVAAARRFPALVSPWLREIILRWLGVTVAPVPQGPVPSEAPKNRDRVADADLDYVDVDYAITELARKVYDFEPFAIVAVGRGGAITAGLLSKKLKYVMEDIPILTLSKRPQPTEGDLRLEAPEDITGKRVFLVDDACRLGASMKKAKEAVEEKAAAVETAVILLVKPELGSGRDAGPKPVDHPIYRTNDVNCMLPWDVSPLQVK